MESGAQPQNELLPGPFISYSRQDLRFAQKLYNELRKRNRDAWVDLEGIEPSEEWLKKPHSSIDSTQAEAMFPAQPRDRIIAVKVGL